MSALFKHLTIAALAVSLGACTLTPVDLLIPAGVAIANHISTEDGSGPISVSAMLKRVRGEPETSEPAGGPVSVEAMLAKARGEEAAEPVAQAESSGRVSVEAMLAKARAAEPSESRTVPPAKADETDTPGSISLDALRAQVLARAPDAPAEQVCK